MIETLLEEIAERGWTVNNLFQINDGMWQCNLRTQTHYTSFGQGYSAVSALAIAIEEIENAEPYDIPTPTPFTIETGTCKSYLEDLRFKLVQSKPFNRRV